jgi:hypothetical protein
MAYDPTPEETENWPVVARGYDEWRRFLSIKRGFFRLEDDLAKFFGNARTVNTVLRKVMEANEAIRGSKRKTA